MTAKFTGDENICNFANELRNYLRNGTGQQQKSTSNQSGRDGSNERWNNPFGRRHLRGRDNESERSGQRTVNKHQSRIAKHIDNLVEKLGTKARTTVYHSFDELPADMKEYIREREKQGKKVRGWYENGHILKIFSMEILLVTKICVTL